MKATYISPKISKQLLCADILTTSNPDNYYNRYEAGEGLAPARPDIWQ